ncbi:MAG TPA: CocE/NonD family hydrolase [Steroidobacteraceae bacterium]|nr:CocE/NonD family hydrolase [Steroidobacteraceae bacterium]
MRPRLPLLQVLILALLLAAGVAQAQGQQDLDFHAPASTNDAALTAVMRDLAVRVLPVYQEADATRYLNNLSALQLVAGSIDSAWTTRQSLLERRRPQEAGKPIRQAVVFDLYMRARALAVQGPMPFAEAYGKAYQQTVPQLSDLDAFTLNGWLARPVYQFREALQRALDQARQQPRISTNHALDLVWTYLAFDAYRSFSTAATALIRADDQHRYATDDKVTIMTPDLAELVAHVIRPRNAPATLPTLLEFTLGDDPNSDQREIAAHGYVGVRAYVRSPAASQVLVFEHDGKDATAVIDWITHQSWSNGQVGMFGLRYSGFTAWAALRELPPALKAVATADATAPGIDFPMRNGIFRSQAYRWIQDATNSEVPDYSSESEDASWHQLEKRWYEGGQPYRDLDRLAGRPSPIFQRWLSHPSYDYYWHDMVPFGAQFARIKIPVLSITGYYSAAEVGSLYYFDQQLKANPKANHTLIIGPWTDGSIDTGPTSDLLGLGIDPVAQMDLDDLRYQWFDQIFRHGPWPAFIKGRVNVQLAGANDWLHGATLESLTNGSLRFYLDSQSLDPPPPKTGKVPPASGGRYRLLARRSAKKLPVTQLVSLTDRSDSDWTAPTSLVVKTLNEHDTLILVSDPLGHVTDLVGTPKVHLDFTPNKFDMDLAITLYEQLANGDYVQLYAPAFEFRASYARDPSHRHLLQAGVEQQLDVSLHQVLGRRLQAGSRLVISIAVNKRPDRQINYGTGGDVSTESLRDGKIPLRIRWHGGTYFDLPVHH